MRYRLGGDRPSARVEFYSSLRGTCQDKGLAALVTCAKHKPLRRGIALRIEVSLPSPFYGSVIEPWQIWGRYGVLGCWECAHQAVLVSIGAVASVMPDASYWRDGGPGGRVGYVHLFDGAGTPARIRRASEACNAAANTLAALGFDVTVINDKGGKELWPATDEWKPTPGCEVHFKYGHGRANLIGNQP